MKVQLTAVTPLHIGGRESVLNPLEFVVEGGCCYVVSEDKLISELQKKEKLDAFSSDDAFSSNIAGKSPPSLRTFLSNQNLLNPAFLKQISNYSSDASSAPAQMDNLRPFIRDAFQRPFLPGTSIKGAIRTAFLYGILKNMTEPQRRKILHDFVKDRLKEFDKDSRRNQSGFRERFKKEFAQEIEIEEKIFQRFSLGNREPGPNTDLFRCLRVSDSTPFKVDCALDAPPALAKVETIKVFSAGSKRPMKPVYAECLPPRSTCEFEISVDERMLEEFQNQNQKPRFGVDFSKLKELLKKKKPLTLWTFMGNHLWEAENKFFSNSLRSVNVQMPTRGNPPLVRLGWGSGLLGTTVDMLLDESDVQKIRNTLFVDLGKDPAPKTRRLVARENDTYLPLGWAKVEVI